MCRWLEMIGRSHSVLFSIARCDTCVVEEGKLIIRNRLLSIWTWSSLLNIMLFLSSFVKVNTNHVMHMHKLKIWAFSNLLCCTCSSTQRSENHGSKRRENWRHDYSQLRVNKFKSESRHSLVQRRSEFGQSLHNKLSVPRWRLDHAVQCHL